jgi:hypothetical protein
MQPVEIRTGDLAKGDIAIQTRAALTEWRKLYAA